MTFYSRPFEVVEVCLNRACTALAILNFRELLHLLMTNKPKYTQIVDTHVTKGKPRALGLEYQLKSVVRTQSRGYW